jgi:hypothetical protein
LNEIVWAGLFILIPNVYDKDVPTEHAHPCAVQDVFEFVAVTSKNYATVAISREKRLDGVVLDNASPLGLFLQIVPDCVPDQISIGKPPRLRVAKSGKVPIFNDREHHKKGCENYSGCPPHSNTPNRSLIANHYSNIRMRRSALGTSRQLATVQNLVVIGAQRTSIEPHQSNSIYKGAPPWSVALTRFLHRISPKTLRNRTGSHSLRQICGLIPICRCPGVDP